MTAKAFRPDAPALLSSSAGVAASGGQGKLRGWGGERPARTLARPWPLALGPALALRFQAFARVAKGGQGQGAFRTFSPPLFFILSFSCRYFEEKTLATLGHTFQVAERTREKLGKGGVGKG